MNDHELNWLRSQQPTTGNDDDPGAHDRARRALVRHTAVHAARPGPGRGRRLRGALRSRMLVPVAATGMAAVAAALVLSIDDGGGGGVTARTTGTSGAEQGHGASGPRLTVHRPGVARHPGGARAGSGSPLVRLADYVTTSGPPTGNATLVARTTSTGGRTVTVYDLYADDGQYFFSPQRSGLQAQVDAHNNQAGGLFSREIAAAKLAATGDVQTAAQDMADAPDPKVVAGHDARVDQAKARAKLRAAGIKPPTGPIVAASSFDNWAWEDSQDALIAGAGDPQVRAGVLQILAILPGVTVTHGTADGQPTLVLTAGAQELGSGYAEQLTIDADSGVPIRFVGGTSPTTPATTVGYKVSRVTFASLARGAG